MASLEDLVSGGLSNIIQQGGLPLEEALYQRQAQAEREATFGRGLGISSVTRDALAKARMDAAMAAQNAQLAALGQAAGVTQQNANRAQQASQFDRTMKQQKSLANQQMLASGLAGGVGAAANLGGLIFAPEIRKGLRGLFGAGTPGTQPGAPGLTEGGPLQTAGLPSAGAMEDYAQVSPLSSLVGPNLFSGFDQSFAVPDLSVPDFSGFDQSFDLSGLFDYDPLAFDWSQMGWT